jgi:hypothetical protein
LVKNSQPDALLDKHHKNQDEEEGVEGPIDLPPVRDVKRKCVLMVLLKPNKEKVKCILTSPIRRRYDIANH